MAANFKKRISMKPMRSWVMKWGDLLFFWWVVREGGFFVQVVFGVEIGLFTFHLEVNFSCKCFFFLRFFGGLFWAGPRKELYISKEELLFRSLHHHKIISFMYLCFYNVSTIYLKLNVNEVLMNHYMML